MNAVCCPLFFSETYKVGEQLHGFVVQEVAPVPEYQLTAVKLEHIATGAQHLHVARKDSDNVFWCVVLCTNKYAISSLAVLKGPEPFMRL